MKKRFTIGLLCLTFLADAQTDSLTVSWDKTLMVSKSVSTLQVVVNPPLRPDASIHNQSFEALKNLGCDYVRFVPWLPYPKLGVAELQPPSSGKTYWDFSLIDPITLDFLNATKGHPVILNFSTIPQWMYKTDKPVGYPENPDSVVWNYTQGTEPRDSSLKEIGDYYGRLFSWYANGGFTDERGGRHQSGYHYPIPYWEVLNEVDFEHNNTAESYTRVYDAIVSAIRKVSPGTKFVGLALADPIKPEWYEYFLNPKNHKEGIPVDMISYHFYAIGSADQPLERMQYSFFDHADGFLNTVHFIEDIRKRLSPATKTTIDEVGSILNSDFAPKEIPIDSAYWNLSGALYAYLYVGLSKFGIDIIGESQLVGYPTQFPSVSMMDWKNGKPNSRYYVLKLIHDNFAPGDNLVATDIPGNEDILAQGFNTREGKKVLLINKRNKIVKINLTDSYNKGTFTVVDPSTGEGEARQTAISNSSIEIKPFAVGVIRL
jgi:hypothetical protein